MVPCRRFTFGTNKLPFHVQRRKEYSDFIGKLVGIFNVVGLCCSVVTNLAVLLAVEQSSKSSAH